MSTTTPTEIRTRIASAFTAGDRKKVYALTSYAEQESAYSLDREIWGIVARAGRSALVDLDREAAYAAGRQV